MDIELRLATANDSDAIAAVHYASWISAYREILPSAFFTEVSLDKTKALWKGLFSEENQMLSFVAERKDTRKIVGFIHGGASRDEAYRLDAEIYSLYVLPELQRLGIGRALLSAFSQGLRSQTTFKQCYTWVLSSSAAVEFFQAMGAQPGQQITEETGVPFIKFHEVKFRWNGLELSR